MLAVHFGAGNIGRGFIGQLLHESGYDIVFVDVRDDVVEALKTQGRYDVILADEDGRRIPVDRVTALHSTRDAAEVTERIAAAGPPPPPAGPPSPPAATPGRDRGASPRPPASRRPSAHLSCPS